MIDLVGCINSSHTSFFTDNIIESTESKKQMLNIALKKGIRFLFLFHGQAFRILKAKDGFLYLGYNALEDAFIWFVTVQSDFLVLLLECYCFQARMW